MGRKENASYEKSGSRKGKLDFSLIYPVCSIYMSINDVNPGGLFGGNWERIKDTFLLAAGSSYEAGDTGGEAAHQLTANEMPGHTHTFTGTAENHTHTFTGTAASHSHTNCIFNVNNTNALMPISGIRLKDKTAYEWITVTSDSTTDTAGTAGGTTGDPCGITKNTSITPKGTNANTSVTPKGTNASTGGGAEHNNMPPYLAVYMWKRVA